MTTPAATAVAGPIPDVTVITGAYNSMPYITRSVTSVLEQTIGTDRLQILVINDGSTDGTGAISKRSCPAGTSTEQGPTPRTAGTRCWAGSTYGAEPSSSR